MPDKETDGSSKSLVAIVARAIYRPTKLYPSFDDAPHSRRVVYMRRAQAAISALADAGMVVLPREPTEAMLDATAENGVWKFSGNGMDWVRGCYRAMIAAGEAK